MVIYTKQNMDSGGILVVDDNPGDLRLIEEIVDEVDTGTPVITTTEKQRAIELVRRWGEYTETLQPDPVIVDWNLAKGTGREVLEEADENLPHSTFVIMTSVGSRTQNLQSEVPEADQCLTKPTTPEEYKDTISSLID